MPPLPADSIHARACKLKCEKILTRPVVRNKSFCIQVPKQKKLHIPVQQHEKIYKLAVKNRSTPKDTPMVRVAGFEPTASWSRTTSGLYNRSKCVR